jgi:hypothetical protein
VALGLLGGNDLIKEVEVERHFVAQMVGLTA